jgi:hypothetical protein
MDLTTQINNQLTYLYSNGKGEAGLEVGVDIGLGPNEFIQIPKSMEKMWVAKIDEAKWNVQHKPFDKVEKYDEAKGVAYYVGKEGWISRGPIRIWGGDKQVRVKNGSISEWVDIDEFHIVPHTIDDFKRFYTVNVGHIDDDKIENQHHFWVHSVRLWSLIGGLVTTSKNQEYTLVDDPVQIDPKATEFAAYAINFSVNAWTACAARTTSWKKSNHATGGTPAIGLPRRWMQKENFWKNVAEGGIQKKFEIMLTSAFYVATHATSVHAVLSQFVPEDLHHWCYLYPSCGLVWDWDIGESIRIRMSPREQVAGAAMVVDAVVVMKMLVSEGVAPALEFVSQAHALMDAYKQVKQYGMLCAVYKKWFFDGHPGILDEVDFSQRSSSYFDLVSELAIIAVKFYAGSTISMSPSLQNAARQSPYESIKSNWAAAALMRTEISSGDLVKIIELVRGVSSTAFIQKLTSADPTLEVAGMMEYNQALRSLGDLVGMTNVKQLDPTKLHHQT